MELMCTAGCIVEQFEQCGLKTLKQQLHFKKLLLPAVAAKNTTNPQLIATTHGHSAKVSREHIQTLSAEEKRLIK